MSDYSDYKTTDYCARCGESPDSATHWQTGEQGGHIYVPPGPADRCKSCGRRRDDHDVRHRFVSRPPSEEQTAPPISKRDDELVELLEQARAAHEALPPDVRKRREEEHALSFAYGNLRLDVPVSRAAFEKLILNRYPHWSEAERVDWLDRRKWDLP